MKTTASLLVTTILLANAVAVLWRPEIAKLPGWYRPIQADPERSIFQSRL